MKSEILIKHVLSFKSENLPSPPRCRDFKFCILLDNINLFSLFDSWHADKTRLARWAPVGSKYEFPISSVRRRRFIPNNPTGSRDAIQLMSDLMSWNPKKRPTSNESLK